MAPGKNQFSYLLGLLQAALPTCIGSGPHSFIIIKASKLGPTLLMLLSPWFFLFCLLIPLRRTLWLHCPTWIQFSSVQFSRSVVSNSLRPHEPQHARPPCPSPTPRVHPNPCPLSRWCHPTISSSVIPFSSCPQSSSASGSLQMSQHFASGGQSTGVSALASVLPMNPQDRSPLGWTGWITLQSKGLSRVFSNTTVQKHQFFGTQLSLCPTLTFIHDHWKNHSLD